jgi:hypothetical protein
MARIRYIKPDFFKDEDVAALPLETRLCYIGLWTLADKGGRLEDRPKRIKAELFPYDPVDVEDSLLRLSMLKVGSGRPFILRYLAADQRYIQIVRWEDHQRPHHTEAESRIPPAPPYEGEGNGKGNGDGKLAQRELEVKELLFNGELTVKQPLGIKTQDQMVLDEILKAYQGRGVVNEGLCLQELHWLKPPLTVLEVDPVCESLLRQVVSWNGRSEDRIPALHNWIKGKRWNDKIPTPPKKDTPEDLASRLKAKGHI